MWPQKPKTPTLRSNPILIPQTLVIFNNSSLPFTSPTACLTTPKNPRILHEILAVFLPKWGEQSGNKHGLECSKDCWRWRQIGTELTGAEHPIPNFVGFSWLPCQRTCPEWSVGGLIVSDHCLVLEGIQCLLATRKSVEPLT